MELMQLEMFVAVSEEGSFRLAAERVLRTPPAVSIGVRKLEDEIGSRLFVRSRHQSGRLTAEGEKLYAYAARLLRLRDEMCAALKEEGVVGGALRVGVTRELGLEWMQTVAKQFHARYPSSRVDVICDHDEKLVRDLHGKRIDVVVLSGVPETGRGAPKFVLSRLARPKSQSSFWAVRMGQSKLASMFEQELRRSSRTFQRKLAGATGPKAPKAGFLPPPSQFGTDVIVMRAKRS